MGREAERERFLAAFDRSPVTVVVGPGGHGKTSLVLASLHASRPHLAPRTLSFSASPSDRSGEELALTLLGALSAMLGGGKPSGSATADTPGFVANVIDLADALDAVILLDDLHFVEPSFVRELLEAAASYARKSRFIATTRAPIDLAGLEEQVVKVGPMTEDALASLAEAWSPGIDGQAARAAARDAGGSPFWLKQRLIGSGSRGLLDDLPAPARRWVSALAWLEIPVPDDSVLFLPGSPTASDMTALEQRGLLERVPEGVRLHAVARAALLEASKEDSRDVAAALRSSPDPILRLESIRLDEADGRRDEAIETARAAAADLVARGLAPRLWQVLEGIHDPRAFAPKIACASDLGGGAALAWAMEHPGPAEPALRLRWLEVIASSPAVESVATRARELAVEARESDPQLAASALVVAARAFVTLAKAPEALAAADEARRLAGADETIRARADAYAARALVFAGRAQEALALAGALESRTDSMSPRVRREIDDQRAAVYFNLGRSRRAHDLFVRMAREGLVSPEQLGVRTRLVRSSLFALELGELERARALLDELSPVARRSDELFAFYSMNELRYAAALGDFDAAEEHLAGLVRATSASKSGYWSGWIASPRHYLALLRGQPLDPRTAATERDFPLTRALAAWHEVRATGTSARLDHERSSEVIDAEIVLCLARANAAALGGDTAGAVSAARAAVALSEEEGLTLWLADSLVVLGESIAVAGGGDLGAAASRLGAVADTLGPSRYRAEADLFAELARGDDADLAVLDRVAATASACAAVRRARTLLGFEAALDRVDAAVLERARVARPTVVAADHGARPGLGLDTRRGRVLLPRGTSVDLAKKPVAMKILVTLFDGAGRASKEHLVERVWDVQDYHPLRDDKRLQVAISRLRALLGDESLVETTEDGYRLAPSVAAYRV